MSNDPGPFRQSLSKASIVGVGLAVFAIILFLVLWGFFGQAGLSSMPRLIEGATVVQAAGTKPKEIREHVGRVNTGDAGISVARMRSPEGWLEPGPGTVVARLVSGHADARAVRAARRGRGWPDDR